MTDDQIIDADDVAGHVAHERSNDVVFGAVPDTDDTVGHMRARIADEPDAEDAVGNFRARIVDDGVEDDVEGHMRAR